MFKMALYQNHVILVQWYNWYKKVQLLYLGTVANIDSKMQILQFEMSRIHKLYIFN